MLNTVADHTQRIVLPYFDPDTGDQGWQFGFPPGASVFSGNQVKVRVFLNRTMQCHRKVVYYHKTADERGTPEWAWIHAVDNQNNLQFVRLEAPEQTQGSVPIKTIDRSPPVIYTPEGISRIPNAEKTEADYPYSIPVPESSQGKGLYVYTVGADVVIATCLSENDRVLAVWPTPAAFTLQLWTSHIARILYLNASTNQTRMTEIQTDDLPTRDQQTLQHVHEVKEAMQKTHNPLS